MAILLNMPAIVADATEAVLYTWMKSVGDTIAAGEPVAEIETEKAAVEMDTDHDGVLARILVEPGTTVAVGAPIAVIAAPGDDEAAVEAAVASAGVVEKAETAETAEETVVAPAPAAAESAEPAESVRLFASPLARRLARERGIDVSALIGSGPSGRILRADVEAAVPAAIEAAPVAAPAAPSPASQTLPEGATTVPLTRMRQAIARRLTESKTTVPHFYLTVDVKMDALLALRREINAAATRKITVNDLVVRAIALALRAEPEANVGYGGDHMIHYATSDISVAIATEGGLLTPVVRNVDSISITALSETIGDYATRAQAGKIRPDELVGGSFTVSNLGMFGTREFSAILNPPQAGILAVGAAQQRAVVVDGELAVATMMTCTLSADHRAIDGAVAAKLMAAFTRIMESPMLILM